MKLSAFIKEHSADILAEWDASARLIAPASSHMTSQALRDHAEPILAAIALDIDTFQTAEEEREKSHGQAPDEATRTAASIHGTLRGLSGFSLLQLTAEFRALRSSVLRLWLARTTVFDQAVTRDIMRFNEAVDQALAESVVTFQEQANQTRDRFLAILGHDLRSPLAAISMSGELLVRSPTDATNNLATGKRLRRSAATMTVMVNDLLEYSRTQLGGKMPMAPQPAEMGDICQAALHDASAAFPDCRFEEDSSGDLRGNFDSVRLQQVLTNLLTNAAQYREVGTPVAVTVRGLADSVSVRVANRGPVIPPEALTTVFSALVQLPLDPAQTGRPTTSMGLGLFIARETVLEHGGTIEVHSDEATGTAFTVCIPRELNAHGEA